MTQRLTSEHIHEAVGDIGDAKTAAILATGATLQEFEEAAAWLSGESEIMADTGHELVGVAENVYEILTTDDENDRERE